LLSFAGQNKVGGGVQINPECILEKDRNIIKKDVLGKKNKRECPRLISINTK